MEKSILCLTEDLKKNWMLYPKENDEILCFNCNLNTIVGEKADKKSSFYTVGFVWGFFLHLAPYQI